MRLSWPSPFPTLCGTGRFAVGTVWPATAPPPFWVAFPVLLLPPLLAVLPPLEQPAATTDATASPSAMVIGRVRPLVLLIGYPSRDGIVNACSGRQAMRTWRPRRSPRAGTSVFCRLTTSSPPPSRSTT